MPPGYNSKCLIVHECHKGMAFKRENEGLSLCLDCSAHLLYTHCMYVASKMSVAKCLPFGGPLVAAFDLY